MNDTSDPHQHDGRNPDDRGLSEELESLYHRVARFDQPAVSGRPSDTHQQDGDPDVGNPNPSAHGSDYQYPLRQEELMDKIMMVKAAYERMLTYWPYSSDYKSASCTGPAAGETAIAADGSSPTAHTREDAL